MPVAANASTFPSFSIVVNDTEPGVGRTAGRPITASREWSSPSTRTTRAPRASPHSKPLRIAATLRLAHPPRPRRQRQVMSAVRPGLLASTQVSRWDLSARYLLLSCKGASGLCNVVGLFSFFASLVMHFHDGLDFVDFHSNLSYFPPFDYPSPH